jgi:general secretion pathway protein G
MIRKSKSGFTLVEILIVVIILGILAAIVIPQFTNASQDARRSSVASTVQTLRSQIELWKLQHGDTLPDLVTDWTPLTTVTTFATKSFGPYMQSTPTNPMVDSGLTTVIDGDATTAPDGTYGFVYDATGGSGKIWGVIKDEAGAFVLAGD